MLSNLVKACLSCCVGSKPRLETDRDKAVEIILLSATALISNSRALEIGLADNSMIDGVKYKREEFGQMRSNPAEIQLDFS